MQRINVALLVTLGTLGVSGLAFASDAGAPAVPNPTAWDVDASVMGGATCANDVDAWVQTNGHDVTLVFRNLGVSLGNAGPMAPLAGGGACSVRVPATIPVGAFPQAVTQTFNYGGITRTAGATGALSTSIKFFGFTVSPIGLTFDDTDAGSPSVGANLRVTREERFDRASVWVSRWCSRARPTSGVLQVDLKATARLSAPTEVISMFTEMDGVDLHYDFQTAWESCTAPSPP